MISFWVGVAKRLFANYGVRASEGGDRGSERRVWLGLKSKSTSAGLVK